MEEEEVEEGVEPAEKDKGRFSEAFCEVGGVIVKCSWPPVRPQQKDLQQLWCIFITKTKDSEAMKWLVTNASSSSSHLCYTSFPAAAKDAGRTSQLYL